MSFNRAKHVKYWRMCSNMLPDHYTSTDSSRITLGFFIVAALDLLDVLHDDQTISPSTRQSWIDWIYSCQLDSGGFRGTTGMDLRDRRNGDNEMWDPATVPATFFALAALLVLGDNLERVKREETMEWLPKLQRKDGSFGEILMNNESGEWQIGGGRDLRYCCCAAGVAYVLQGAIIEGTKRERIFDEDTMVSYIRRCQSYSGGFGESPSREAHSGLTYCAVAALKFVLLLQGSKAGDAGDMIVDRKRLLWWMLERQTSVLEEDEESDEDGDEDSTDTRAGGGGGQNDGLTHAKENKPLMAVPIPITSSMIAGFNGREGKIADTCYCWWNVGALSVLKSEDLINTDAIRRYLCEKVQHMIGGFGKGIDAPPDVLHSYLGLAALASMREDGLKSIDPTMCISHQASARLEKDLKTWHTQYDSIRSTFVAMSSGLTAASVIHALYTVELCNIPEGRENWREECHHTRSASAFRIKTPMISLWG